MEIDRKQVVAKNATTATDGKKYTLVLMISKIIK